MKGMKQPEVMTTAGPRQNVRFAVAECYQDKLHFIIILMKMCSISICQDMFLMNLNDIVFVRLV